MRNGIFEETKYATSKTKPSFATNPIAKTPIKPANSKHFGGGVAFKALTIAALAGLSINGAYANPVDVAPQPAHPVLAPIPEYTQTEFGDKENYTEVYEQRTLTFEKYVEAVAKDQGMTLEEFLAQDGAMSKEEWEKFKDLPIFITPFVFDPEGNPKDWGSNEFVDESDQLLLQGDSSANYYIDENKYDIISLDYHDDNDNFIKIYIPKSGDGRIIVKSVGGMVGDLGLRERIFEELDLDENTQERITKGIDVDFIGAGLVSVGSGYLPAYPTIYNPNSQVLEDITADYINNGTAAGIYNAGEINSIQSNFINNASMYAFGQGISGKNYLINNIGEVKEGIINSNFINNTNYVVEDLSLANRYPYATEENRDNKLSNDFLSSHIITTSDLNVEANQGQSSIFTGNMSARGEGNSSWNSAPLFQPMNNTVIFASGTVDNPTELSLTAKTGGKLVMNDEISGNHYKIKVTGDETGVVYLNNNIRAYKDNNVAIKDYIQINYDEWYNPEGYQYKLPEMDDTLHAADITLEKTNLVLGRSASVLDGHNLTLNSGMLSLANGEIGVSALNNLTVNGNTNFYADVDLANKTMDRVTASEYGSHRGNLNVAGMNLLSDAEGDSTSILFADKGLKDNVTTSLNEINALSPIYKYTIKYDNRDDAGYFVFNRGNVTADGGTTGNQSDAFNPAVLGSSSTAAVGAIGTMNQTLNHAFGNLDNYMSIPYLEREAMRTRNRYALSMTGDETNLGRFSPLYQKADETSSVWVKPYATFETVGLKNGPKVHNNAYGTIVGFDSEMQHLRRGWDRVITGYIGYNGASQRYAGVDSTQNGGLIGGTVTMYKGNFFNSTTLNVGASVAQNQNMYGSEDFTMLISGLANKAGYNFEFKEGKVILQPSMLMSYTFVNTFDYTNSAGLRIDNKPLHAIQLAPGVKVIGNLKGGWQPYASAQMVWNLMGETDATANGVKLPEMSIKPYVQYGVGVQKRFKDRCMAYGQAMIQNGGRNGISLTAGFRWALGKEGAPIEKVQNKRHLEATAERSQTKNVTSLRGAQATLQSTTSSQGILRSTQNDGGKYTGHSEASAEESKTIKGVIASEAWQSISNRPERKVLKQLSPAQKAALTGKNNTSITAKSGTLRQY